MTLPLFRSPSKPMWELPWIQKENQHHTCMALQPHHVPLCPHSLSKGIFFLLQTLLGGAEKALGGRRSRTAFLTVTQPHDSHGLHFDSLRPQLSEL